MRPARSSSAARDSTGRVRPDVRRTLTRETAPRHRLAPLLCPAGDEKCGRETDGWRTRAETSLEQGAEIRRLRGDGKELRGWRRARRPTDEDCAAFARRAPVALRFERYRSCLESTAERGPCLPDWSHTQAPTKGWLMSLGSPRALRLLRRAARVRPRDRRQRLPASRRAAGSLSSATVRSITAPRTPAGARSWTRGACRRTPFARQRGCTCRCRTSRVRCWQRGSAAGCRRE